MVRVRGPQMPNDFSMGLVPRAYRQRGRQRDAKIGTWVVVKIMVPFWVLNIIRHLIFRVPKKGP